MSTNNFFKTDLYKLYNIVQSSMLVYPKEILISVLRDFFSHDHQFHYVKDQWGFPNTTDHTDLPLGSGLNDNVTSRIFIGENYRYKGIYYPAILVKNNGSKYTPVSINREQGAVEYEDILYDDGYGHQKLVQRPKAFTTAGFWDGSFSIDVFSRSLRARDEIVELIGICFAEINFDALVDVGLIVKPPTISGPSEQDDRNDKLFKQSITLEIKSQWRREIPIGNIIETVAFSMAFSDLSHHGPVSENLTINTSVSIYDTILNI